MGCGEILRSLLRGAQLRPTRQDAVPFHYLPEAAFNGAVLFVFIRNEYTTKTVEFALAFPASIR
jgi:hypothetical protein